MTQLTTYSITRVSNHER